MVRVLYFRVLVSCACSRAKAGFTLDEPVIYLCMLPEWVWTYDWSPSEWGLCLTQLNPRMQVWWIWLSCQLTERLELKSDKIFPSTCPLYGTYLFCKPRRTYIAHVFPWCSLWGVLLSWMSFLCGKCIEPSSFCLNASRGQVVGSYGMEKK